MIRINLQGAKSKKGKRGSAGGGANAVSRISLPQMQVGQGAILVLAALMLGGVGYWCYWDGSQLQAHHDQLQRDISAKEQRIRDLKTIKEACDTKQKQQAQLQQHFDVIDHLRASQEAPTMLLSAIGGTVNRSDTVWLVSISDGVSPMTDVSPKGGGKASNGGGGQAVELNGFAASSDAVARFMTNLMNSGYFSNVRLKDTKEGETNGVATFSFTLVCEKKLDKKA